MVIDFGNQPDCGRVRGGQAFAVMQNLALPCSIAPLVVKMDPLALLVSSTATFLGFLAFAILQDEQNMVISFWLY